MATSNLVRKIRTTVKGIPPIHLENIGLNHKFVKLATPPAQLKTLCSGSENNSNRMSFSRQFVHYFSSLAQSQLCHWEVSVGPFDIITLTAYRHRLKLFALI